MKSSCSLSCVLVTVHPLKSYSICNNVGFFPGFRHLDAVSYIGASGLYDVKKIGEWAAQSRLDPNDPKNTSIMQLLKVGTRICRCEEEEEEEPPRPKRDVFVLWWVR